MHAAEETMLRWLDLYVKPFVYIFRHWTMSAVKIDSNCTCAVADFWVDEPHH